MFNSVINSRLDKFLNDNNKIPEAQIARANSKTSDHMFVLKTIVDKMLYKEKKTTLHMFCGF